MNEKIKKAIEVAKGLEVDCETCEQQRQHLIELLESCEEPEPLADTVRTPRPAAKPLIFTIHVM